MGTYHFQKMSIDTIFDFYIFSNTFPLGQKLNQSQNFIFLHEKFTKILVKQKASFSPTLLLNFRQILSLYFDKTIKGIFH